MLGFRFIIQSDKSPDYLDERIETFIVTIKDMLEQMTDEQFNGHISAVEVIKLEEPKKISKQADVYWNEINSHQFNFERGKRTLYIYKMDKILILFTF